MKAATGSAWRATAQIPLPVVAACTVETAHAESPRATRAFRLGQAPLPGDGSPRRDNLTPRPVVLGIRQTAGRGVRPGPRVHEGRPGCGLAFNSPGVCCLVEVCVARLDDGQGRELRGRSGDWRSWRRRGRVLGAGRLFEVAGGNRGLRRAFELAIFLLLALLCATHLLVQLAMAGSLPLGGPANERGGGGVDGDLLGEGDSSRGWLG
ncbi:hypothetical protein N7467_001423 [Penicillium canescens]|nr:hypothetical protein N7467_001423 [Penicillium canescens]